MALRFLADTNVIKRLDRPAVRHVVEPRAAAGDLARARISDLEVGHSARHELKGLTVLHYDADFDLIAAATGQTCSWVVPAGAD